MDYTKLVEGNVNNDVKSFLENPFKNKPTIFEAIEICEKYEMDLHPDFLLYWNEFKPSELIPFLDFIKENIIVKDKELDFPLTEFKRQFEILGVEHIISKQNIDEIKAEKEANVIIINELNKDIFLLNLGIDIREKFDKNEFDKQITKLIKFAEVNLAKTGVKIINNCNFLGIRDKAGSYIGARMGRPEKAKMRKQFNDETKSVGLFPVGTQGGRSKNIVDVIKKEGYVVEDFRTFWCPKCNKETIYPSCEKCMTPTIQMCFEKYSGETIDIHKIKRLIEDAIKLYDMVKDGVGLKSDFIDELKNELKIVDEISKKSDFLNFDNIEKVKNTFGTFIIELNNLDKPNEIVSKLISSVRNFVNSVYYKKQKLDINSIETQLRHLLGSDFQYPKAVKGMTASINKHHTVEHIIKPFLRAKHNVCVFRDGTVRYDMIEMGFTHFKPKEIGTSIEKLHELGYTEDYLGNPLENVEQIVEMFPQDVALPDCVESGDELASDYVFNTGNYLDELLQKLYGLPPFYNFKTKEDTIGTLVIGLAPHTSAGIVGRVIGYTKTQGCFSHPVWHAAQRRNLDGDENGVLLLLDGLINFSRDYLPDRRGSRSVTNDTMLFIEENKKLKSVKIGNYIDEIFEKKGFEVEEDGFETLKTSGLKTFSFNDENLKVSLENVSRIIRHKCDKKVFEIKTSDGWIKTTEDHSIFALDFKFGKIVEKKAGKLKKGDFIISLGKLKVDENNLDFVNVNDLKIKLDKRGVQIPKKINLNESFFRLLGFIYAEGYINENKIEIGNSDEKVIDIICKDIKNVLNYEPNLCEDKREEKYTNGKYFRINLPTQFVKVLKKLGVKEQRALDKEIPDFVFRSSKFNIEYFLEGYCFGDGTSYLDDKQRDSIRLYTASEKLASGLSLLAFLIGKKSTCRKSFDKRNDCLKYEVFVSNYKLRSSFWSIYHLRSEINEGLKLSCLNKIERLKLLANINLNTRLKSSSKFKIEKILVELEKCNDNFEIVEKLKLILEGDLRVEIVNEVNQINYEGYVYDLEVPKYQNFLCGPHPIFAHNTMDVSLVLTSHLYLDQIDDEVHGMDIVNYYPQEFYEACKNYESPKAVKIEKVDKRLEYEEYDKRYLGYGFTHTTDDMNNTILCSSYKSVPSMTDKLDLQLGLGRKIRAVDADSVGTFVIDKHFLKDIKGNLRKFSMQTFRCTNCNTKYRRPPLIGKCTKCGNSSINFTIHEGSIKKYLNPSFKIIKEFKVDPYITETIELTNLRVEGVFGKELEQQKSLNDFFGK